MASVVKDTANRGPRVESEGATSTRARAASRLVSAFVFAALVALLPLAAAPYGSVEPWWTALFDAAVFLLAALWAI
jgi:hypothetical protein